MPRNPANDVDLDEPEWPPYEEMASGDPVDDGPLPGIADLSSWTRNNPPERRFIIDGWIVRGAAGLLSGMEGVGKSLIAQQMATCAAAGKQFLGLEIEPVKAVYITCEDPIEELWRRQEAINATLGIGMEHLQDRLMLVSLCGELGNELGTFDQQGRLSVSARYRQIEKTCLDFGANLVVLDNAAHLFAGNENARHEVAAFLGLLERLSKTIDGAALLLAHPNKQHAQGNKQGNEYSGSTGWSAHVRNRLFLDYRETPEDGTPVDDDDRVLRKSKANYGKRGEEIHFRWHNWAFTRVEDLSPNTAREISRVAEENAVNERYLACLDKSIKQRRATSLSPSASNYAPRIFAKMTEAKGCGVETFERAQERLLHLGMIAGDQRVWQRSNRAWAIGIGRLSGCTNHAPTMDVHQPAPTRTNHPETLHNSAPTIDCTNHAQTSAQTMHQPAQSYSTDLHTAPPSPPIGGDPYGASPAGGDDPPPWMDEAPPFEPDDWRGNPILNGRGHFDGDVA